MTLLGALLVAFVFVVVVLCALEAVHVLVGTRRTHHDARSIAKDERAVAASLYPRNGRVTKR